jgi:ribonuclease VapC
LTNGEAVIDSSAAIALARRERGADSVVPQYLAKGLMSAVNLAEFVQVLRRSDLNPESYLRVFEDAGLRIVPADTHLARLAGELERTTRRAGLSLGDRFCLALAISGKRPVITTDRMWLTVDFGVDVILARDDKN